MPFDLRPQPPSRAVAVAAAAVSLALACSTSSGSDDSADAAAAGAAGTAGRDAATGPLGPGPTVTCSQDFGSSLVLNYDTEYSEGPDPGPALTLRFFEGGGLYSVRVGDDAEALCEPVANPTDFFGKGYFDCSASDPASCAECFDAYDCGGCVYVWGRNGNAAQIAAVASDCDRALYTTISDGPPPCGGRCGPNERCVAGNCECPRGCQSGTVCCGGLNCAGMCIGTPCCS